MSKNIAAWTEAVTPPAGEYVQYISINTGLPRGAGFNDFVFGGLDR